MNKKIKVAIALNLDWPLKRYHELYQGIQQYSKDKSWVLVLDHFPEKALNRDCSKPFYAGIIGRIKYDAYEIARNLKIPMVNTWQSSSIKDISSVFCDSEFEGELAANHMLKRGFRNFISVDYRNDTGSKVFYEGFYKALKPYKCTVKRYLINRNMEKDSEQWEKFNLNFQEWIKEWKYPLAIVTAMGSIAPKLSIRCQEYGLRIPDDVAIASCGNDLTYCKSFSPSISSVDSDYFKVGYQAARMLDLKIQGKSTENKTLLIPPRGFVSRESTDTYAVSDSAVKTALRFIADNCHKNIQINDVVYQVPIARRSLQMRFRKSVGHSIVDEINRVRITTLKRLLIESDAKINTLFRDCGFSSPLHLRRVFLKYTNMTPGEYRRVNSFN